MTRILPTAGFAVLVLASAMMIGTSPALAESSEEAQKACEKEAEKHEPPLSSVDWEAFMADCLADATTSNGQEK